MRFLSAAFAAALLTACAATAVVIESPSAPSVQCASRDRTAPVTWHAAEPSDAVELARWCRAVGAPIHADTRSAPVAPPPLDELVIVSWNAHLAEGELPELIASLRSGAFTDGRPVPYFVLLVQELYRRGDAVPAFDRRDRTAFAIVPRDPDAADVEDYAASLGLSLFYVPSMRNGGELREDRGNAIISTEPLLDPLAIELPLARQRRVALGAAVHVTTPDGVRRLEFLNAHLEPLSSPRTLWIFTNPRARQVRSILDLTAAPRFQDAKVAGVVLGGDFNTVQGGDREDGYRHARAWSTSLRREDTRPTHMMGRLDYLFFRLADGWQASTRRLDDRFGSDHYPVLGTLDREPGSGIRDPAIIRME